MPASSERMGKRAAVLLGAALLFFACDSNDDGGAAGGSAHCASTSRGCRCESSAFELDDDENAATSCNAQALSGSNVQCCYDLDSDGYTTSCDCATWTCVDTPDTDECVCGWSLHEADRTGDVRTSCSTSSPVPDGGTPRSLCCEQPAEDIGGTNNGCSCNGNYFSCADRPGYANAKTVTSCGVVARPCAADDKKSARSCDGLKWKPERTSTSSSSSSSGGSKAECTSDSACSGKCSGDCYRCRSGSCTCGYKGTSGACIF